MPAISKKIMWLGVLFILATGLIHLVEAPEELEELFYKGVLFYANFLGALVAAYGIFRGNKLGWNLGLCVAAGSLIAYVCSRTIGLPGMPAGSEEWLEPLGVLSLVVEGLFVVVFVKAAKQ